MERGAEIYQAMPLTERELAMSAAQYWGRLKTGLTGLTGLMPRGEIWFADAPGGDRPVLVCRLLGVSLVRLSGRVGRAFFV